MPSRTETFGLVALEAQACGTPVVASRAGSLPEVVSDRITGALVTRRDPGAWARTIAALLGCPARLQAMRAAAVARATRYSWHVTATSLMAAYHEAVNDFTLGE
jgi:D-inositol-3-phosphate glycosyltransferase